MRCCLRTSPWAARRSGARRPGAHERRASRESLRSRSEPIHRTLRHTRTRQYLRLSWCSPYVNTLAAAPASFAVIELRHELLDAAAASNSHVRCPVAAARPLANVHTEYG